MTSGLRYQVAYNCQYCRGTGQAIVHPDVLQWEYKGDNKYETPLGEFHTFHEEEAHAVEAPCPGCYPSYYPHIQTIN